MKAAAKREPAPSAALKRLQQQNAALQRELAAWRLRRVKANLDLLRLFEFNDRVLGNLTSGVVALDGAGKVSLINQAAASLLRVDPRTAKGRPVAPTLLARAGEAARPLLAALAAGGESLRGEMTLKGAAGDRLVQYNLTAFGFGPGGEPEARVLLLADLTRVREQEARLQRQEQLAGVGRLSADIAHQLKNPLAGIQGLLQVSLDLAGEGGRLRQNLEMVLTEVRRMDHLVADTLRFARPAALDPQALPLNDVAREGLALVTAGVNKPRLAVRLKLTDPSPVAVADRDQLREVVINLAKNALEAMPQGGHLTLETHLHKNGHKGQAMALLVVRDTGGGIPAKVAAHVFDPFFTTKPEGSGLGLPACRRIVDALGGDIRFDSKPGRGTAFTVALPAVAQPRTPSPL